MDIKAKWEGLSPKQKQQITIGGAALVIFGFLWIFMFSGENEGFQFERAEPAQRSMLTSSDIRAMGVDALEGKFTRLERENQELRIKLDAADTKIKENSSRAPKVSPEELAEIREQVVRDLQSNLSVLEQRMSAIASNQSQIRQQEANPFAPPIDMTPTPDAGAPTPDTGRPTPPASGAQITPQTERPPTRKINPVSEPAGTQKQRMPPSTTNGQRIIRPNGEAAPGESMGGVRIIRSDKKPAKTSSKKTEEQKLEEMKTYIPAGSIISGVLLTGLDAPTGELSRKDPLPILLRVNQESILPSKYTADFRECMIVASGFGDLSSSRAMLRTNTMSCIRNDGGVIEVPIYAHAVGEDGKLGVRGPLVDKAGEAMKYAMFAGTLEGLAGFFQKAPIPTLNTGSGGGVQYQSLFNSDSLQAAGAQGIGKALDKLTDYWIARADKLVPVVEIDNGRSIDFMIVAGSKITTIN